MLKLISTIGFTMLVALVCAQPFTYQGFLREDGLPANGTFSMTFRLYSASTGGILLGTVGPSNITVANGLFTTVLNFGTAPWTGADRFLEIVVAGTTLSPRVKINPTPYAIHSNNADRLDGLDSTAFLTGIPVPLTLSGNSATHIIRGENASTAANAFGVMGVISSTAPGGLSAAVRGQNNGTGGAGIGVWGSQDGSGWGVYGTSVNGLGVYGTSVNGRGVYGAATATSGTTYSVWGENSSTSGTGVVGWATAASGNARGVWGITSSSASNAYGVLGSEPSGGAGHAVYASGTLAATGTKSFQIDHPLRPETHYLNHFCAEGPEPYNIYRGNVVTNAQGYATIHLPDYFEAINRDPTIQLTVIGGGGEEFVQVRVVREIQNNRFVIRTSVPHVKVSWRVEAIRNDLYVQRYGFQTEQEKEDEIKGKYLMPELYGQPEERGIHYRPTPEPSPALKETPALKDAPASPPAPKKTQQ